MSGAGQAGGVQQGISALQTTIGYTAPSEILDPGDVAPAMHPGYPASGGFYGTYDGNHLAAAVPAADTLYCYPFFLPRGRSLTSLFLRCTTGGAGSSVKAALWANGTTGRPVGVPLLANNAGASTASGGMISLAVSGTIDAGWYWIGSKYTGTLPNMMGANTTTVDGRMAYLIGSSTTSAAVGAPSLVGLSYADAYANDIAALNLTGVTFTNHVTAGLPVLGIGFA